MASDCMGLCDNVIHAHTGVSKNQGFLCGLQTEGL